MNCCSTNICKTFLCDYLHVSPNFQPDWILLCKPCKHTASLHCVFVGVFSDLRVDWKTCCIQYNWRAFLCCVLKCAFSLNLPKCMNNHNWYISAPFLQCDYFWYDILSFHLVWMICCSRYKWICFPCQCVSKYVLLDSQLKHLSDYRNYIYTAFLLCGCGYESSNFRAHWMTCYTLRNWMVFLQCVWSCDS